MRLSSFPPQPRPDDLLEVNRLLPEGACRKPFALFHEQEQIWRLWYNGPRGEPEAIGLALHQGEDLGF